MGSEVATLQKVCGMIFWIVLVVSLILSWGISERKAYGASPAYQDALEAQTSLPPEGESSVTTNYNGTTYTNPNKKSCISVTSGDYPSYSDTSLCEEE